MGPVNTVQVMLGIAFSIIGQFFMSLLFGEVAVLIFQFNQEQATHQ